MKAEEIYYRLWSKGFYHDIVKKYESLDNDYLYLRDYLPYVKIEENDKAFLKEMRYQLYVEKHPIEPLMERYSIDYFLRGLFAGYVKKFESRLDDEGERKYQVDWLNHTMEITKDKCPEVYKWCDDYLNEYFK